MANIKFRKISVDPANKCEACSVFDVNNDGVADIVCGEYWYQGPDFKTRHKICDIKYDGNYLWDFSDYPMDVDGDGKMDVITASWWSEGVFWRENPGGNGEWATHKIIDCKSVETVRYFDIDGDGMAEIFPNCPGMPVFYLKLITDVNGKGTGRFDKFVISEANAGHGLGFGDIDGDGKPEIILTGGILKIPAGGKCTDMWEFLPEFDLGKGVSVPILVHDVNGDGVSDIIWGAGHNYGLFWLEQSVDENGGRAWTKHVIDAAWAQYHDMQLVDIDNDGQPELLTGKRWKAHNGNDPGDNDDVFVCWYKFDRERNQIRRHIIDYGDPMDGHTGLGIYFWTADLTGSGKLDIIAPGKEGLYILYNM